MGRFTVRALRAVLGVVFTGTVLLQVLMVWTLVSGSDPEDGTMPLAALRVIVVLGMLAAQVALHAVWRLVAMVRRGTVFSHAAFGHVNRVIGSIVAVALLWFVVTGINAPGQREDPGVTVIMAGIGLAILGVALVVLVLRMLLDQATQLRAELDEVI
ncbi:DUF2975 domain-containing protein [Kitasatospora albolonga]|uniref:DUF2975 domain-containing protein n=1 Tax=Kitasatospora albolonga TaxID=68173 RepID=UPI0031F169D8